MRTFFLFVNSSVLLVIAAILIIRGPKNNHISYEPIIFAIFPSIGFLIEIIFWRRLDSKGLRMIRLSISSILLAVVVIADQWNFLVQYDRWLARGMPDAGEFRISAEMRDALRHPPHQ